MFNRLRRFFSKPQRPSLNGYRSICISGNVYARIGSDLTAMEYGTQTLQVCGPDYVAPNGVPVKQIAYAIALIEGFISINDTVPVNSPFVGLG
jgi:hypothetical protein